MLFMMMLIKKFFLFIVVEVLLGWVEVIYLFGFYFVNGKFMELFYLEGMESILFGMGCFWGVECLFWLILGVYVMVVGYVGGYMLNLIYYEICIGCIGYMEIVKVVYDLVQVDLV